MGSLPRLSDLKLFFLQRSLGQRTEIAFMPIYGKIIQKSSSPELKRPMTLKLGMHHIGPQPILVYTNDGSKSTLVRYAFIWKDA